MSVEKQVQAYFDGLPGKRGVDIPEELYDRIFSVANGITQKHWKQHPLPHQLQYLHDQGYHTPDDIHMAYDHLPHPDASNLKLGEYDSWAGALGKYKRHIGKQ